MELKEYLTIFKNHSRLFLVVVAIFLLAGLAWQFLRPLTYKSSLTLNVTRTGSQKTDAYRYDDFYRLQADERFADTVVRWLGSPRIVVDIYNDSKIVISGLDQRQLSRFFKAQRLSSQMVAVTYIAPESKTAEVLSRSIVKILNEETEKLNKFQKEENWFVILGNDPVVRENKLPAYLIILASIALGAFFGFWAVLIRHYFKETN